MKMILVHLRKITLLENLELRLMKLIKNLISKMLISLN